MLKILDKCLWKKDNFNHHFPKLDHDIEVDVLIIGGGVSGALSAYIFQEKNINVAVIERGKIVDESSIGFTPNEDIETDFKKIAPYLNDVQKVDAFRFTLETIYKLDEMTDNLADKCEFIRRPSIYYTNQNRENDYLFTECEIKENSKQFSFPFCRNLSYNSGAKINSVKLTNELFKYCAKLTIPIYEFTEVYEINIEENIVKVTTKDKKQIKCKKVLMASGYDSSLFFDMTKLKPIEPFKRWHVDSLFENVEDTSGYSNQLLFQDEVNELETLTQYKYHKLEEKGSNSFPIMNNKAVEYHFNDIMTDTKASVPYIDEHGDYPNIYFNLGIGNKGLLYGLMGAILLADKYLGIDNKRLNIFKFNR